MIVAGLALIIIVGVSPIGLALLRILEERFPAWNGNGPAPAGFVILGGGLDADMSEARRTPSLNGSAERLTVIADLARRFPSARIIYSSGSANLFGGAAEADHVVVLLESFGVPRQRIETEAKSRNTAENAAFSKAVAQPKAGERWVLVTSGTHMPRAIAVFRAAGFEVEACPVDWRTGGPGENLAWIPVFTAGLGTMDAAAREFVGLAAYWLSGRSSELFPAPR
jgi:uncharacterized SAM-binding protein YcdF (DUF218 family)